MFKASLLLTVVLLAVTYVRSDQTAAAVVEPLSLTVPQTLGTTGTQAVSDLTSNTLATAAGSSNQFDSGVNLHFNNLYNQAAKLYPVDLIAKKQGCISFDHLNRVTTLRKWTESHSMTLQACWRYCLGTKSSHAALSKGNECFCSNAIIGKDAPKSTSSKPCSGNRFQMCGSDDCADYYVLRINSETLRHSLRNLEADNIWVHKNGWSSWARYVNGQFDFSLVERFPASTAIYATRDCPVPSASCPDCFNVVLNGFEDAIITSNEVTPIDVEWDLVFARQKSSHADADVLLFRKSLCEWVLKENEKITKEFKIVEFSENARTITLVDKMNSNLIYKVSSGFYVEFEKGVQKASFAGKWFNKIHHFRNYFIGINTCI